MIELTKPSWKIRDADLTPPKATKWGSGINQWFLPLRLDFQRSKRKGNEGRVTATY